MSRFITKQSKVLTKRERFISKWGVGEGYYKIGKVLQNGVIITKQAPRTVTQTEMKTEKVNSPGRRSAVQKYSYVDSSLATLSCFDCLLQSGEKLSLSVFAYT